MQLGMGDRLLVTLSERVCKKASILCSPQLFHGILCHDNSFALIFSLHNPVSHPRTRQSPQNPGSNIWGQRLLGKQGYPGICCRGACSSNVCPFWSLGLSFHSQTLHMHQWPGLVLLEEAPIAHCCGDNCPCSSENREDCSKWLFCTFQLLFSKWKLDENCLSLQETFLLGH